MFAHNSTTKGRSNIDIGRKAVRATADIPLQLQSQKVKGQGHQATLGDCSFDSMFLSVLMGCDNCCKY